MIDIGVVYYRMKPGGGEIEATWYTTRFEIKECGTGLARGDTSNGFAGEYEITYYYPDGTVSAELDLRIEKSGEIYDLYYLKDGEVLLRGVGIETSDGLCGGYRMLG